jgi:hypothetical protein
MKINVRNLNTKESRNSLENIVESVVQGRSKLNLVIILCPLFTKGDLTESTLMSGSEASIKNSRINSKWVETVKLINLLSEEVRHVGITLHIEFLFADNGTPMNTFNKGDQKILVEHESVWRQEVKRIQTEKNASVGFRKFSEIAPEVPRFVNVNRSEFLSRNPISKENIKVDFINKVNKQLELWFQDSPDCPVVKINRKNKKRVSRLLSIFDLDSAFVMCTTYLGKRFRLPRIFRDSVFVWFERMDVLLTVDDMLEEFESSKKIMIKV